MKTLANQKPTFLLFAVLFALRTSAVLAEEAVLQNTAGRQTFSRASQSEMETAKAIPWIRGAFRHVLNPPGMAPDSNKQWYINDHCIFIDASDRLHWFGITNPYPKDRNYYGPGTHRHIGHAVAEHPFGPWQARADALSLPADTQENIGACFVVRGTNGYVMIYGYNQGFSFAHSDDLETWEKVSGRAPLDFGKGTRDPCVHRLNDGTYLLYGAAGHAGRSAVVLASSRDLEHWTPEPPALLSDIAIGWGALESPFLHQRGADYYLFVNFSHRQYEETLVFHSRNPRKFDWASPLCTLFAHAAEVFVWRDQTYITHCGIEDRHWSNIGAPYGLWLAELAWVKPVTPDRLDGIGSK